MNKQEKYKVFNFSNSVCFINGVNRSYQIGAWKNGVPGFVSIPFEEIEYASGRTCFFRTGILGFENKVKDEIYKELHIDEDKTWTREKIEKLLVEDDKDLRQMVLEIRDMATMGWIRGEALKAKNTDDHVSHGVLTLIENRNLELLRGQFASKLAADKAVADEKVPVNREEFSSLKKMNEDLSKQVAQLLELLGQQKVVEQKPVAEPTFEEELAEVKLPAKRGSKKKE